MRRVIWFLLAVLWLAPSWGQSRPPDVPTQPIYGYIVPIAYGPPDFRTNILLTIHSNIPETAAVQITADEPTFGVDVYRTRNGWLVKEVKTWVDIDYLPGNRREDPPWICRAYVSESVSLDSLLGVEQGDIVIIESHPLLLDKLIVSFVDNKTNDPFGWYATQGKFMIRRVR